MVCVDYKQKVSLPLAQCATSSMFYRSDRMEMSVFGAIVVTRSSGRMHQQNILYISSIIENSALMTSVLLDDLKSKIPGFGTAQKVTIWSDVGPHFRCYDVLAHLTGAWRPTMAGRLRVCWFTEKHGKGEVDAMFSHMGMWLSNFLRQKDAVIKTPEELVAVCQAGAKKGEERDPSERSGVEWLVRRFEMAAKPQWLWKFPSCEFQITLTYCLEMPPTVLGGKNKCHWKNFIFADRDTGKFHPCAVEKEKLTDRDWRRGYFQSKKWDKKKPEHGTKNRIMSKFETHTVDLQIAKYEPRRTRWEKKTAAHARRLLLQRERWHRAKERVQDETSSTSSDSNTSSNESEVDE